MPEVFIDMKVQLPQTYSQNDQRWKNTPLGTKGTIGDYGCLVANVAMVACYFGHIETPLTLNEKLRRNDGYANGNLFIWGALTQIYSDVVYEGQTQTPDPLTQGQMDDIRSIIDQKFPVFLQIDTIPATSGLDEHWVLAIDYDGDDFIVQDPWDGATKRITSWGVKPQELIYAYAYYSGTPVQTAPTIPGSSGEGVQVDKATFEQLVNKASQWDIVANTFNIDKNDATGGQKVSRRVQQQEQEVMSMQSQRDDAVNGLSRMQGSYNTLQMQYTTVQAQYNTLQQDYLALQQSGQTPSQVLTALQKQYEGAQNTIKELQQKLNNSPILSPEKNPSTIPFWQSKKVIVTTLTSIFSAALVILQSVDIKPEDDWQTTAVKLFSAAATALGISAVGSQYVKAQGAIDKAAMEITRI